MLLVLVVVPTSLSHELSQNLNWGLSSEFLLHGHVKIINEDDALHAEAGSVDTSSNLFELHVDNILNLVAVSLGRETALNRQVTLTRKHIQ